MTNGTSRGAIDKQTGSSYYIRCEKVNALLPAADHFVRCPPLSDINLCLFLAVFPLLLSFFLHFFLLSKLGLEREKKVKEKKKKDNVEEEEEEEVVVATCFAFSSLVRTNTLTFIHTLSPLTWDAIFVYACVCVWFGTVLTKSAKKVLVFGQKNCSVAAVHGVTGDDECAQRVIAVMTPIFQKFRFLQVAHC